LVTDRVVVPKVAELVAAMLRRRIVRGELSEGESLPLESTLLDQFGVSRPTLREALRILETEGLISVRRGSRGGSRVHVPTSETAARFVGHVLEHQSVRLADVYEARCLLEPPCVALLAERRTAEDVATLRRAIEEARLIADVVDRGNVQNRFHDLVLQLAGNETIAVLGGVVRHIIDRATQIRATGDTHADGLQPDAAVDAGGRSHELLVELVEAGDAEAAAAHWRRHLDAIATYLTAQPAAERVVDLLD
jgi:DNA-binding FadR family transcriptional regulator